MTQDSAPPLSDGDQPIRFGGYVVAVIDVLGQKEAIRALSQVPQKEAEQLGFVKNKLRASLTVRNFVRDTVLRFLASYGATPRISEFHLLDFYRQQVLERSKAHPIGTYLFSDTIVIHSPILNNWNEPGAHGIYSILAACGSTMMTCMAAGVPIRGAVEVGWGLIWDHGELYGPAFLSAYELEQCAAQWPRIVVGPEITRALNEFSRLPGFTDREKIQAALAKLCQELICNDFDAKPIVDYLGTTMRGMVYDDKLRDLFVRGLSFAVGEHERFTRDGNSKLCDRYAKVRRYYEERKEFWT